MENGIWLCANCSDLIDKNDGADYSALALMDWKKAAEESARRRLEGSEQVAPLWSVPFSAILYANFPRLAQMALLRGFSVDLPVVAAGDALFRQDYFGGARAMLQVEALLDQLHMQAEPLAVLETGHSDLTGLVISFDGPFFTKNGIEWTDQRLPGLSSDWTKAPHIWCPVGSRKLVLPYNPQWITTGTAISTFRGGKRRFAGIALVKEGDPDGEVVIATPLVLGIPEATWLNAVPG